MPAAPKDKPVVIALDPKTPEWEVVEALRNRFVTTVTDKEGKPKITSAGTEQVRRASATEIVEKVLATVLLNASEETSVVVPLCKVTVWSMSCERPRLAISGCSMSLNIYV